MCWGCMQAQTHDQQHWGANLDLHVQLAEAHKKLQTALEAQSLAEADTANLSRRYLAAEERAGAAEAHAQVKLLAAQLARAAMHV